MPFWLSCTGLRTRKILRPTKTYLDKNAPQQKRLVKKRGLVPNLQAESNENNSTRTIREEFPIDNSASNVANPSKDKCHAAENYPQEEDPMLKDLAEQVEKQPPKMPAGYLTPDRSPSPPLLPSQDLELGEEEPLWLQDDMGLPVPIEPSQLHPVAQYEIDFNVENQLETNVSRLGVSAQPLRHSEHGYSDVNNRTEVQPLAPLTSVSNTSLTSEESPLTNASTTSYTLDFNTFSNISEPLPDIENFMASDSSENSPDKNGRL